MHQWLAHPSNRERELSMSSVQAIEPSTKPLVSVIIPTRRRPGQLEEALASVYGQEGVGDAFEMEVIVVYNFENEDVPPHIRVGYPEARYCKEAKPGASAARNAGLRAARGRHIAFLDDDDLWFPHKLRVQVPVLEAHPEIGVLYGQMRVTEGDKVTIEAWPETAPSGRVFEDFLTRTDDFVHPDTLLVRRELFEVAGHFNENFPVMEHYDLFLRLAFHARWEFLPGPVGVGRFSREGLWFTSVANGTNERVLPQIIEQALAMLPETADYEPLRREARSAVCATIADHRWWNGGAERVREYLLATLQSCPWMLEVPRVANQVFRVAVELARRPQRPVTNVRAFWRQIRATRVQRGLIESLRMRRLLGDLLMHAAISLRQGSPRRAARVAACAVCFDPTQLRRKTSFTIPIGGVVATVGEIVKTVP
jgi:glycosyltransferase involved in cell wall biosynthesis